MTEYVELKSNDQCFFYLERRVAELSEFIKKKIETLDRSKLYSLEMNIRGEILEIIVDYLNHKFYYENLVDIRKAPEFNIKEELALEVLVASINLEC